MWSDIETEEDGFWTKLVENSIYNNPVTQGGYLIYEGVRWVLKQASPESASEKSFKLIPFPVSNPVVYHFHPVAFVEQVRRMFCCEVDISFQSGLTKERCDVVSSFSLSFLQKIGSLSENPQIIISSTIRTASQQANAMYTNLKNGNNIRYAAPGRAVVDVYNKKVANGKTETEILNKMIEKIKELQKVNKIVSRHCVSKESYNKLNVIDISFRYNRLKNPKDFIRQLAKETSVKKVIHPFSAMEQISKVSYDKHEPAVHVEIYQNN